MYESALLFSDRSLIACQELLPCYFDENVGLSHREPAHHLAVLLINVSFCEACPCRMFRAVISRTSSTSPLHVFEAAKVYREKEELKMVEERLRIRHGAQTKFAKNLKRFKNMDDKDTRDAYH